ncbi:hypothetical protein MAR_018043 [Mya arenaria]|uniref:Uncharacterized protein n=1 Tax=Mya arenaria TaxID=6604 RepID=A0ABY7EDY1_MYAAR|nr:hypothetical protein MAR_018043 [Mya arenaria]
MKMNVVLELLAKIRARVQTQSEVTRAIVRQQDTQEQIVAQMKMNVVLELLAKIRACVQTQSEVTRAIVREQDIQEQIVAQHPVVAARTTAAQTPARILERAQTPEVGTLVVVPELVTREQTVTQMKMNAVSELLVRMEAHVQTQQEVSHATVQTPRSLETHARTVQCDPAS